MSKFIVGSVISVSDSWYSSYKYGIYIGMNKNQVVFRYPAVRCRDDQLIWVLAQTDISYVKVICTISSESKKVLSMRGVYGKYTPRVFLRNPRER